MAKIIKIEHQLEKEYYAIKQAQCIRVLGKEKFASMVIYAIFITVSIVANISTRVFIPLTVCLGLILLIAVFVYFCGNISQYVDTDILAFGMQGERTVAKIPAHRKRTLLHFGFKIAVLNFQKLLVYTNNINKCTTNIGVAPL